MKRIAITGALSQPKRVFIELIEKSNNKFDKTVSKATDVLVVADINAPTTNKRKAAEAKGVITWGEAELMEFLSESIKTFTLIGEFKETYVYYKDLLTLLGFEITTEITPMTKFVVVVDKTNTNIDGIKDSHTIFDEAELNKFIEAEQEDLF